MVAQHGSTDLAESIEKHKVMKTNRKNCGFA